MSAFCSQRLGLREKGGVCEAYCGRVTLWSKKPLCVSCHDVVHRQLRAALPNAALEVLVDEEA